MARRLLLIRHAKAVAEASTDARRELSPRGLRDAAAAGQWLFAHDLVPQHALVSSARRARQTWEAMAEQLGPGPATIIDERIYDNSVKQLLAVIRDAPSDAETLALVGHNPSMHELAIDLDDGAGAGARRSDLLDAFPTAGIALLDVDGDWAALTLGDARLRDFHVARA